MYFGSNHVTPALRFAWQIVPVQVLRGAFFATTHAPHAVQVSNLLWLRGLLRVEMYHPRNDN